MLTGFTLRDAPAFDDWLYFAQERLRNMQVSALGILGYPDQARRYARQTLTQVQQVVHPFSQTFAQALVCHLWISLSEWETALAQTQALVALAVEYGAVVWASYGRILQGAAVAGLDQSASGLALMHQGLTELQEQG